MVDRMFKIAAALMAGTAILGCDDERQERAQHQSISYSVREPGSTVAPTNDISIALIAADGPRRFVTFQKMVSDAGEQCSVVTSAILRGGVGSTDEWRVSCADSGHWSIWLKAGGSEEVLRCSTSECDTAAEPPTMNKAVPADED